MLINNYFFTSHSALPQVSSLQLGVSSNSPLTLNCSSSGSPALTVVWTKDGSTLPNGLVFAATQTLRDGTTASYDNLLEVSGHYSAIVGVYSCIIHDSLGHNSLPVSLQVNGKANSSVRFGTMSTFLALCRSGSNWL